MFFVLLWVSQCPFVVFWCYSFNIITTQKKIPLLLSAEFILFIIVNPSHVLDDRLATSLQISALDFELWITRLHCYLAYFYPFSEGFQNSATVAGHRWIVLTHEARLLIFFTLFLSFTSLFFKGVYYWNWDKYLIPYSISFFLLQ